MFPDASMRASQPHHRAPERAGSFGKTLGAYRPWRFSYRTKAGITENRTTYDGGVNPRSRKYKEIPRYLAPDVELVAAAWHAVDEPLLLRAADLLPEIHDMRLDGVRKKIGALVPDMLEDLSAGEHALRIAQEIFEQGEFFARQVDGDLAAAHALLVGVERQVFERERPALAARRAAEQGVQPRRKLLDIERPDEVVVDARGEAVDFAEHVRVLACHHDRHVPPGLPEFGAYAVAVHARKGVAENDDIIRARQAEREPVLAVACRVYGKASLLEPSREKLPEFAVAFDNKKAHVTRMVACARSNLP